MTNPGTSTTPSGTGDGTTRDEGTPLAEALHELGALAALPVYLPPKPEDEDDRYVLHGAVLELTARARAYVVDAVNAYDRLRAIEAAARAVVAETDVWFTGGNYSMADRDRFDDARRALREALDPS